MPRDIDTCAQCGARDDEPHRDGCTSARYDDDERCPYCGDTECAIWGDAYAHGVPSRHASREEQHARYLDCGPQAWDDRDD